MTNFMSKPSASKVTFVIKFVIEFLINPLRTLNAGLRKRQREEIEFTLYTLA